MNALNDIRFSQTPNAASPKYPLFHIYWTEARLELLRLLRLPSFALPSLLFPAMFYLLFGVLMGGENRRAFATYLLATYSIFGVMGPGLFGFGVSVAIDREHGALTWRRALPSIAAAYFVAKMLMAMAFAVFIFVQLALLGSTLGGVQLQALQWLQLLGISLLAALPFCALGLVIGTLVSAAAAPAVVNFIYLPMAFLSGLWIPITMLPDFIKQLAPLWPSYHAAQLALRVIGQDSGGAPWLHFTYLIGFSLIMLWLATLLWSRMKLK